MTLQRAAVVYVLRIKSNIFEGRSVTRIFMKSILSPAMNNGRLAMCRATVFLPGCLVAAALFFTGCHKAADTMAAPPPAAPAAAATDTTVTNQDTQAAVAASGTIQNPNPATPAAPPMGNPNLAPLAKANGEPDLTAIDSALMGWVFANRRVPNSFADFAATAGVAIPPPPPGKKYVIGNGMHVRLVDQ
jgi:hypothetical protein